MTCPGQTIIGNLQRGIDLLVASIDGIHAAEIVFCVVELSQRHFDLCFALPGLEFRHEDDAQVDEADQTGHGDGDDAARLGGLELPAQIRIITFGNRGAVHEDETDGCGENEWDTRGSHDDAVDSMASGRDGVVFER